jgi:hypothetical protein
MSTPLRYVYRDHSTSYGTNYGGQFALNANGAGVGVGGVGGGGVGKGFQPLPYDEFGGGCDIPPPCPTTTGDPLNPQPGDVLTGSSYCTYVSITWYNTGSDTPIGTGETYTIQESDYFYNIYYVVEYPNGSKESSSLSCLNTVAPDRNYDFWALSVPPQSYLGLRNPYKILLDKYGNTYIIFHYINQVQFVNVAIYATLVIQKRDIDGVELWTKKYDSDEGLALYTFTGEHPVTFDDNQEYIYCSIEFRQYITQGFGPYWDGIQVYKINSQTGELVWRHKYNPRMQNVRTNSGLFFDAYLNSVWVAATDLSLSYLFRIDADDPSNVISGLTMSYVGNNSITTYVGYSTLIRSHDNNKLYVIWIDGSNRHVIFELNSTGTSINSTVKRVSASTTLKEGGTIPCKFIKVKLADNSNAYIGGMGFSNYANALVLYDENFNAVKRTGSLGNIKSIEVDPEDNKKMYGIAYGTSNANLSSFDIRFGNNALVSSFTADTDLTTVSTCTAFTTTSGYNWIADNARTSDYGIATNNLVNRAVIALSSYDNGGSFDGRGSISGFFTLGMPLTSSGNTTNFAWPNPSGLIAGRLNQSYALTGVSPAVSGLVASGGSHIVQASGEANTTVQDITGTSIEIYATSSFL